jgi:branched-chain amino acid transport system substrate-binding protein
MKKKVFLAVASVMVIVALGSVYFFYSRPVHIGVILNVQTPLGNEENLYARYYRDIHPKIGLRPVEFIIENQAASEQEVKDAYNRLVKLGVSAIIGGTISAEGMWIAEESGKSAVPTFGITSSSSLLSGKNDSFYRIVPTNDTQAKAVAKYYNELGLQKLVILSSVENKSYAEPIAKIIQENFNGECRNIPFYSIEETYEKVLSNNPDSVFCLLQAKDVIEVIKRLKEKHPDIKIGSSSWGSSEILSLYSSPLLDGVLLFSSNSDIFGDEYKTEIANFEKIYKMEATKGSNYTASTLNILYQGIRAAGVSRESLKAYFDVPRAYNTAYGEVSLDEYGDSLLDNIIVMVTKDGEVVKSESLK